MAVIVRVVIPGLSREDYDQIRDICGWIDAPPTGGILHTTWWEGDDCVNHDAWESEEAFNDFMQNRLVPAIMESGQEIIPPAVTFHPAHEVFTVSLQKVLTET